MASISASTTHKIKKNKVVTKAPPKMMGAVVGTKSSTSKGPVKKVMKAPKLVSTVTQDQVRESIAKLSERDVVDDYLRQAFGERANFSASGTDLLVPHTASTTRDRGTAAANLVVVCQVLGPVKVLKTHLVLSKMEDMLLPQGIGAVFGNPEAGTGMKRIVSTASLSRVSSSVSLSSLNNLGDSTVGSNQTDSKRGKSTPASAREGSLLVIRALCEGLGKPAEPFCVPLLGAILDETASNSSNIRQAAEDSTRAVLQLAHIHAMKTMIFPVLFAALEHSPEWRVKVAAMEGMCTCTSVAGNQVSQLLPEIIPVLTAQVWDTKPQVTQAAKKALLACCGTNRNPDVKPAIPAVVQAIVKPADTTKAIDKLMATTFVASVDASTLSILCPVLNRGLKEKNFLAKRACCVVIENMSRLVDSPTAVAPFGPLLVPELKKVVENVSFEEIRDAALAALKALTKALGHGDNIEDALRAVMADEMKRVEEEQRRIKEEREKEEERTRIQEEKEAVERALWKEAMDAQRLLDNLALEEEQAAKEDKYKKQEAAKLSTKSTSGKCQGCGLKKCKTTCLFYSK